MSGRPLVEFDHHSARFTEAAEEVLTELRTTCPVGYSESYGGFWVMTSYDAVRTVLADDEAFSVAKQPDGSGGLLIPPSPHSIPLLPGELDPPDHTDWRKLLAPMFSKPAVERLRSVVEEIVDNCLDVALAKGEFDAAADFGNAVPSTAIVHWLGFPVSMREEFRRATEVAFSVIPAPAGTDPQDSFSWIYGAVRERAALCREHPGEDLISFMVTHPDRDFSDDELVAFSMNMLAGGIQTTSALTSYAIIELERDRGLRQRLIDDPALLPRAIDEFLRLSCPAVALGRTVIEERVIDGQTLEPGDRVLVLLGSANRDETKFPQADDIDIDRRVQNLSFGMGGHFCIGQWLAKLEARVALGRLLERMPDYSVDLENIVRLEHRAVLNGYRHVPARTNVPID